MKRSILVAEDHEVVLEVFREWLTRHGYAVLVAHGGVEAITIAKQQRPRLAILDYSMPGMDGITAARAIREAPETRHIPIIMMTAMTLTNATEEEALRGFDDFFEKPFDTERFLAKIRELLKPRVLVIDDNLCFCDLMVRALSTRCAVITANNRKKGMELAVLEDPDLVILDRSQGEEIAMDIIDNCNIPVMMVTGSSLTDAEKEVFHAISIKAIIGKPFEMAELRTTVAALLPQFPPSA
ncbi:MAG: response regulator [bacterium]|nr:response regulator [bacterium]